MEQIRTSWWSRNWKWFVPAGCLTLLLLFAAVLVGIVAIVLTAMKSNTPYRESVAQAKSNAAVAEKLGTPIEAGWWVAGNVKIENDAGRAILTIPIHGPLAHARIHSYMTRNPGEQWVTRRLTVVPDDGEAIVIVQGTGDVPMSDDNE